MQTIAIYRKHVRCNPDVAPRLTSGGYEDKSWCYYPNQHIVQRGWRILMWWWSWCDDVMMWWCDDVMMWWCDDVMMMMMMIMMIMTIVSVEQRPGWGEHVSTWLRQFYCLVFHLFGSALVSCPSSLSFWTGPIVVFHCHFFFCCSNKGNLISISPGVTGHDLRMRQLQCGRMTGDARTITLYRWMMMDASLALLGLSWFIIRTRILFL